MHESSSSPSWRRVAPALVAMLAMLVLGACGGSDDESEPAETATSSSEQAEQADQADTPSGSDDDATSTDADRGDSDADASVEGESESSGPGGPCPDVVVTPNSGDGLFEVQAEGISCDEAVAALKAWGEAGYPEQGPEGFECDDSQDDAGTPPTELRCESPGSGAVIEFETGV